jgi:hypothetical protein
MSDEMAKAAILNVLFEDRDCIPNLLSMLSLERNSNARLLGDFNSELSRALVILEEGKKRKVEKTNFNAKWVSEQIRLFYSKWKDRVSCVYKMDGMD